MHPVSCIHILTRHYLIALLPDCLPPDSRMAVKTPRPCVRNAYNAGWDFVIPQWPYPAPCIPHGRAFRSMSRTFSLGSGLPSRDPVPGPGFHGAPGTGHPAPGTGYPVPDPVRRRGPNTGHRRPSPATGKHAHRVCILHPSLSPDGQAGGLLGRMGRRRDVGDGGDFDVSPSREVGNGDGRPGRRLGPHVTSVHLIDPGE